jgi:hypothetical protein
MKRSKGQHRWEHKTDEQKHHAIAAAFGGNVTKDQDVSRETSAKPWVPGDPPIEGRPETYPPNLFSGQQRRLQFEGMKEGMVYRIFNEEGNNISLALRSGWAFSDSSEIRCVDQVVPSNKDVGTKVCYEVGQQATGHPLYAYVMEMPEWLWIRQQTGPGSREEYHKGLERAIREGTLFQKTDDGRYTADRPPPGGTSLPGIKITKTLAR